MGLDMFLTRVSDKTEVAYWRKANQIHNWFVENVQNGNDDGGTYEVSGHKLKELVDLCKEVMQSKEKAEELLPTREGFFFGSTDYDEYYFGDVKRTIEKLENINEHETYEYYAWW